MRNCKTLKRRNESETKFLKIVANKTKLENHRIEKDRAISILKIGNLFLCRETPEGYSKKSAPLFVSMVVPVSRFAFSEFSRFLDKLKILLRWIGNMKGSHYSHFLKLFRQQKTTLPKGFDILYLHFFWKNRKKYIK